MGTLSSRLLEHINEKGQGAIFGNQEFLGLGSRAAVDQALSRLVRRGAIRRIRQGLYDLPRSSPPFGTLSPNVDEVVKAISNRDGSKLLASGAYAANVLGLSTQVPAKILYHTDGYGKRVKIGKQTIEFRHAGPRRMAGAGKISGLVIQALRYLGRDSVDDAAIDRLRAMLSDTDREVLRQDIASAPSWLRAALNQIAVGS